MNVVEADGALFHELLGRAVTLRDCDALFCLADLTLHGAEGVAQDEAAALALYQEASAEGHAEASLCLGERSRMLGAHFHFPWNPTPFPTHKIENENSQINIKI